MGNYQAAENSAIVLKYGDAAQAVVKGVNKLKLPELTRNAIELIEFRNNYDFEVTAGGKIGRITYGGNAVLDDTTGQNQLKAYFANNEQFTDARFYLDNNHFLTCDLANDSEAGFQVARHAIEEADKNGIYPFSGEIVCNGLVAVFIAHIVDGAIPTMTFPAGGLTITDSGSGFVTAGFKAGMTCIIEGSTSNDGQYLIETVVAGTITFVAGTSLTVEACIEGTTLHGGKL